MTPAVWNLIIVWLLSDIILFPVHCQRLTEALQLRLMCISCYKANTLNFLLWNIRVYVHEHNGLLGCDTMQCGRIPVFQRSMLLPPSG